MISYYQKINYYITKKIIIESNVCDNYDKCNIYTVNDHSNEL